MAETDAILQSMEFGISTGLKIGEKALELMIRFINFIIARYEKSKEFKMKYGDMNEEQKERRKGYLNAKQMRKQMLENGDAMLPINFGRELTDAEQDKLGRYAEFMDFPFTFIEEPVLDKNGNFIFEEDGSIKVKRTYFCLQSDMDKIVIFTEILNKDRQHDIIEKSDLPDEEKEQLHKEVDIENSYEENEKVVNDMAVDREQFYDALNAACKDGNYEKIEELLKEQDVKFFSQKEKGFTETMNKNAGRDYSKGEPYYVVDAKNPRHYIEMTSTYNKTYGRTDTVYNIYVNDQAVFQTNDKISEDIAKKSKGTQYSGWNPEWGNIRKNIAEQGKFDEKGHYFVFTSKEEFSHFKEMFNESVGKFTIEPDQIKEGMNYTKERENIDLQMQTNKYYMQKMNEGMTKEEIEHSQLKPGEMENLSTLDKVDYMLFANNMAQKKVLDRMEELEKQLDAKQSQLAGIDYDDPLKAMEQNGKIMDEISAVSKEYDVYSKYLGSLCEQERTLLSSHAEEVTEQKTANKDASKLLKNYRANQKLQEYNLNIKDFSKEQQEQIKQGLVNGLNKEQVRSYMDKSYSADEMSIRRVALEEGLKNAEVEHCVEIFNRTGNLSMVEDAVISYQAGFSKQQVEFAVDENMPIGMRDQFIEGVKAGIQEEKMQVVKDDYYKDHVKEEKTGEDVKMQGDGKDLTVRTSVLLQFAAEKETSPDDLKNLTQIKNEEALQNVYEAYKQGLSIKDLQPVIKEDITPEQAKGVTQILMTEKKAKEKSEAKERTPSKEQFKKAHEFAKQMNGKNEKNKNREQKQQRTSRSGDAR